MNYASGAGVTSSAGGQVAHKFSQGMAQGIRLVRLSDGTLRAIITTMDGNAVSENVPIAGGTTRGRRITWREVVEN